MVLSCYGSQANPGKSQRRTLCWISIFPHLRHSRAYARVSVDHTSLVLPTLSSKMVLAGQCGKVPARCGPPRAFPAGQWWHLAVCAGLRVSELTGLRTDDVTLPSMSFRIHGKGRRERVLPLWKTTATAVRAWLAVRGTVSAPELFVNARGEPMSRWGFAYVLPTMRKLPVRSARHCQRGSCRRMC